MESIRELIDRLNATDECVNIEAKRGTEIDRSILETICAFSNEPGLNGGIYYWVLKRTKQCFFHTILLQV